MLWDAAGELKNTAQQVRGVVPAGPGDGGRGGEGGPRFHLALEIPAYVTQRQTHLWGLECCRLSFPSGLNFSH